MLVQLHWGPSARPKKIQGPRVVQHLDGPSVLDRSCTWLMGPCRAHGLRTSSFSPFPPPQRPAWLGATADTVFVAFGIPSERAKWGVTNTHPAAWLGRSRLFFSMIFQERSPRQVDEASDGRPFWTRDIFGAGCRLLPRFFPEGVHIIG